MLVTHGGRKAKRFGWVFQDDYVKIKNENGRQEEYPLAEIFDIMNWLTEKFGLSWFPLANNVEKLGQDTEVDGLGVAIVRQRPRNISHAQGASYLGVVLEHVGVVEWNNKQRGIQWRIIHPARNPDELRRAIKAKMACQAAPPDFDKPSFHWFPPLSRENKMYRIIEKNIDHILGSVDEDLDIKTYLTLLNRFQSVDVTRDTEFQSKYCRYWRLFGAGLGQNFRAAYFELMEGLRGRPIPNIGEVTRKLYEVPSNKSGRKTVQFSFASKLLHTLDRHQPIYDSMVATFYHFSVPGPTKSFEVRLRSFLSFYDFLCAEYKNVLSNGLLQQSITQFRYQFSVPSEYTDEKIIDTLIWRVTDLQNRGVL